VIVAALLAGAQASAAEKPAVTASVSEASPFVGQEVVYTIRLPAGVVADGAVAVFPPSPDGFAIVNEATEPAAASGTEAPRFGAEGLSIRLVPTRAGRLTIGPARVVLSLPSAVPDAAPPAPGEDDPFFSRGKAGARELRTGPVDLAARPLPPYAGVDPFSGSVGDFSLSASVDRETVAVGRPATFRVTVSGTGRIVLPSPWRIPVAGGCAVFPEGFRREAGTRATASYALVGSVPGRCSVGPVSLIFFDPATVKYEQAAAGPLEFLVEPAGDGAAAAMTEAPRPSGAGGARGAVWLAGALAAGLAAAILLLLRRGGAGTARRRLSAREGCREEGSGGAGPISVREGDPEDLAALSRSVLRTIRGRAGMPPGEGALTYPEIRDALARAAVPAAEADEALRIVQRLDAARYGPVPPVGAVEDGLRAEARRWLGRLTARGERSPGR
jgi:hypothetical protein